MTAGLFAVVAVLTWLSSQGADFYLKPEAVDWSKPASFTLDAAGVVGATTVPGADDTVKITSDYQVTFTSGSSSFAVAANVKSISFENGKSVSLVVDVPDAATVADFNSSVFRDPFDNWSYRFCTLVKTGAGTLNLNGVGRQLRGTASWDYYCRLKVEGGTLRLQPDTTLAGSQTYVGTLSVAEGTRFVLSGADGKTVTTGVRGLSGAGIVTNEYAQTAGLNLMVIIKADAGDFSGRFAGILSLLLSGPVTLSGALSANGGSNPSIYASGILDATMGVTEVASLGLRGGLSSLGVNDINIGQNGGALRYLGTGETTDKAFTFYGNAEAGKFAAVLDAGATGGIVFAGQGGAETVWTGAGAHSQRVTLTGSNAVPCRVQVPVVGWKSSNGAARSLHIRKAGAGIWSFEGAADQSSNAGGLTVADGTLRFSSIAEKGVASALGTAAHPTAYVETVADLSELEAEVDYAFTLGGGTADGKGMLEYTGAADASCRTRPAVMAGRGGFSNVGAGVLSLAGVTSRDAGSSNTLHLDGTNDGDNRLADVTNGVGRIDVVKEGRGTWRLTGKTDVGSVAVRGGVLIVDNQPDFKWFRLTCQETLGKGSQFPQLQEVALFSADGVRRNLGMRYREPETVQTNDSDRGYNSRCVFANGAYALAPNEAAYGDETSVSVHYTAGSVSDAFPFGNQYRDLNCLFDGGWNESEADGLVTRAGWWLSTYRTYSGKPVLAKPETWLPIVMRVADESPRITSIDLVAPMGAAKESEVAVWKLEGSADGRNWEEVVTSADVTGESHHASVARWYSDWSEFTNGVDENRAGKGFAFAGYPMGDATKASFDGTLALAGGGTFRVNGQPLAVSSLTLDATDGGSVEGVTFAESGTFSLVNLPPSREIRIPGHLASSDALANWDVRIDGKPNVRWSVSMQDGQVSLFKKGFAVIIR